MADILASIGIAACYCFLILFLLALLAALYNIVRKWINEVKKANEHYKQDEDNHVE